MTKIAVMVVSTIAFVTMASATALADSTEPPSPTTIVEGVGGAGNGGADATAFTGGDTSTAAIMMVALVAVGLVVLLMSRRRVAQTS